MYWNNLEARNTRITWSVTIICACFMICTFPHNIYGHMTESQLEALLYNVTLGLQWAQYYLNILMHLIQKDQIWSSCLFLSWNEIVTGHEQKQEYEEATQKIFRENRKYDRLSPIKFKIVHFIHLLSNRLWARINTNHFYFLSFKRKLLGSREFLICLSMYCCSFSALCLYCSPNSVLS